MKLLHRIAAILMGLACLGWAAEQPKGRGVSVTIHDSHGLSAESAPDQVLEVILFKSHTHIHFKISNLSDQALILWRPGCPQGDAAMSVEFRETGASEKVYRSQTSYVYTGGMGIPKVVTLASRNDLIVNVDFLSEWSFPFTLNVDERREMEIRAVYRSKELTDEEQKRLTGEKEMAGVWNGSAASEWQKVRVINRTGALQGPKK